MLAYYITCCIYDFSGHMQHFHSDFPLQPECFYDKPAKIQSNLVTVQRVYFLIIVLCVLLTSLKLYNKTNNSLSVAV